MRNTRLPCKMGACVDFTKESIVWVFENKARPESFNTSLEFIDNVCVSSLVTKGFSCCVVTIKSIQRFFIVVMFYNMYSCMLAYADLKGPKKPRLTSSPNSKETWPKYLFGTTRAPKIKYSNRIVLKRIQRE